MTPLTLWRGVRAPVASLLERRRYRPERHYMRGPGPATRAKQVRPQR